MLAALHVVALPLQLLVRAHPAWRSAPLAVVDSARASATLLHLNAEAREAGLVPGLKLAEAQAITQTLRADVVAPEAVDAAERELLALLLGFSPRIEPDPDPPGFFWLDASGLESLYGSLQAWAEALHQALRHAAYESTLVVGTSRPRLRALALSEAGILVLTDPAEERRRAARVPLTYFTMSRTLRRELTLLGVRTLGDLERLPKSELQLRYGEEAAELQRALGGDALVPLSPQWPSTPHERTMSFEPPERDRERLLFAVKRLLHPLLVELETKSEAAVALVLLLRREKLTPEAVRIESASPTRDALSLLELVRLRLERLPLAAAVTDLTLTLEGLVLEPKQLELLALPTRRDLDAGARALARLQAAFGPESVTYARLRSAHLPEARFIWEIARALQLPTPDPLAPSLPPLVRRLFTPARPLGAPPLMRLVRDEPGRVVRLFGPERLSGGWWKRLVGRDYYVAETERGALLWLYYDRERRRWMQHGRLE